MRARLRGRCVSSLERGSKVMDDQPPSSEFGMPGVLGDLAEFVDRPVDDIDSEVEPLRADNGAAPVVPERPTVAAPRGDPIQRRTRRAAGRHARMEIAAILGEGTKSACRRIKAKSKLRAAINKSGKAQRVFRECGIAWRFFAWVRLPITAP